MPPSRVYRTEGVILRQARLGEADRALTLYTPGSGKVRAVARGAARPRSRLAGHVEPLTRSSFLLARGRNLDIVTQAQALESFLPLREDLSRAASAFYVAELVDGFTVEGLENPPLYDLLLSTLRWLSEVPRRADRRSPDAIGTPREGLRPHAGAEASAPEVALRYFEVALLDSLGYRPELYRCLECGAALQPETNYFTPARGGCLCPACGAGQGVAISLEAQKVLRLFQRGDEATAHRLRLSPGVGRELEGLLRGYLEWHLEREVRSARFLDRLRQG